MVALVALTLLPSTASARDKAAVIKPLAGTVIFDDVLSPGWADWSWARVDLGNRRVSHSGGGSIAVTPKAWEALYLSYPRLNTTGFNSLKFWIYGGEQGGQYLWVKATIKGTPIEGKVFQVPIPHASEWVEVTVPLEDIGAQDTRIDGWWIQNATSETLATFYVDDITLQ
jgi:chitinase